MRFEEDGFWVEYLEQQNSRYVRVGFLESALSSMEQIEKIGTWVGEDSQVKKGDPLFILEAEKVGFDVDAVGSGVVSKINEAVLNDPSILMEDPEGEGWLYEMELSGESQQEFTQKYSESK